MSTPVSTHPQLSIDLHAHVQYTCGRHVVTLFKEYLDILQQLADEHSEALDKLHDALPEEYQPYVDLADHFTDEKGVRIRKAVLARGNDCKRAIEEELAKYEMTLRGYSADNPSNTPSL